VSSAFIRDWMSVYEPSHTIQTDNAPQFASLIFQSVCGLMGIGTRGFGIMIQTKHHSVSSGILLAATSFGHQSFHEEPEREVSFTAGSSVLLSHWMARRFQRIYPDISGYIPDSAENHGF